MAKFEGFGGTGRPVEVHLPDFGGVRRRFSGAGRWIVLALVLLVVVLTSAYTIDPEEVGVVLRFGRFVRYAQPGFNLKLPLGLESVYKVPVERQLKEEFGFRTAEAGVRTRYVEGDFDDESLMLTGDLNIADVEWVVQYRIVDPYKYLFRVRGVRDTFRAMTEAVMRELVGDRTVNEVITVGRQELASLVERQLQTLADQYETGIKVEQVVLQNVYPPDPVKPSFNEVNQAEQRRAERINTAEAKYNAVIPRARGQAEGTVQQAEGYALDRVNRARGEAARFSALYEEYRQAPEVTRRRLYLETMGRVVPQAGRKLIVDEDVRGLIPLVSLDGVLTPPAAAAAGPGEGP